MVCAGSRVMRFLFALLMLFCGGPVVAAEQLFALNNAADPATLDPAMATGVPEQSIFLATSEGLTTLDPATLGALPGMAKSWRVESGGTRYIFELRNDAK